LEAQRETCAEDPKETVERAQQHFEDTETLLHHWLHIQQVFDAQKAELHSSPMEDIAARFSHNLALISDDAVSSEFPDAEKLQMKIYSGSNLLDYGKLSEGTKETVSLAFRLAVLDHLFPDGGGVIVLDDPFTDMDADRAIRSCNLLRDCALRHQIIFLTCREDYLTHLPGNVIRF